MKHKIARIILIALIVIIICIMFFACGSKPTNAETESSHAESYELYVLDNFFDGTSRLTLYNNYKIKSDNIQKLNEYGNIITTYNTTDGTQIIFADNGVTVISPQGCTESFTQGYMIRNRSKII